jgi:hypothetical protein
MQGVLVWLAVSALLACGADARADLVTFDYPGVGIATFPDDINNNGTIVGTIID